MTDLFKVCLLYTSKPPLRTLASNRVDFLLLLLGQTALDGCSFFYLKYTTNLKVCKEFIADEDEIQDHD